MPHLTRNPFWILLHARDPLTFRYFLRDFIVNVALYMPLGFAAHLVWRQSPWPGFRIYGPVLLGLLLSVSMELTQLMVPTRNTSLPDVLTNVAGTAIGVMCALVFEAIDSRKSLWRVERLLDRRTGDRSALMLVFCWIAWLFFPFFPRLGLYALASKLRIFAHSALLDPVSLISTAACWYAAGLLAEGAGMQIARPWFLATVLAVPAQFFITGGPPSRSFLAGAMIGALAFVARRRTAVPVRAEAWAFLTVILLRGLAPFHAITASIPFQWIPFGPTLGGEWQSAASVLIEKVFYYGTAVWLFRASGAALVRSVLVVAALLGMIEVVQTHLPGRTPEITDPLLALLLGFVFSRLSRPAAADREKRYTL